MNGKPWTARDRAIVRRDYPHLPTRIIAFRLRRSMHKIYAMATKLGLHKTPAFFSNAKACGRFDKLSRAGERFRYQKGHEPANKGTRRPGWHRGRMRETQFKKGGRPHTWVPVGSTTLSSKGAYLKRKVCEARDHRIAWKFVHHLLWKEHVGPIPKGHIVTFKNDDHRPPILLSNLECISMAENARRNRMWTRYPPDLAKAIHALGQTKRWLRARTKHDENDQRLAGKTVRDNRRAQRPAKAARCRPRARGRQGRRGDYRKRQG